MMVSKVVVDITFHCRLLVFSQSCCEVSASHPDVGGVAVGASDLISRSMFMYTIFVSNSQYYPVILYH